MHDTRHNRNGNTKRKMFNFIIADNNNPHYNPTTTKHTKGRILLILLLNE